MFKHLQIRRPTHAVRWALALSRRRHDYRGLPTHHRTPGGRAPRTPAGPRLRAYDTSAAKRARADCPHGKHVVGGGALVNDGGRRLVRLTSLLPDTTGGSVADSFYAQAEAPNLRRDFSGWSSLTRYARTAARYRATASSPSR